MTDKDRNEMSVNVNPRLINKADLLHRRRVLQEQWQSRAVSETSTGEDNK